MNRRFLSWLKADKGCSSSLSGTSGASLAALFRGFPFKRLGCNIPPPVALFSCGCRRVTSGALTFGGYGFLPPSGIPAFEVDLITIFLVFVA